MRVLLFLLEKEFRQIFRNPGILRIIFALPLIQLLVLPHAADYETKNINVAIVDHDHSPSSARLISKLEGSTYFNLTYYTQSFREAHDQVVFDKADIILEIPNQFEANLFRESSGKLFMAVNAINGVKANLGAAYLGQVIRDFNLEMRAGLQPTPSFSPDPIIDVQVSNWYNPHMNYKIFMVPGILVLLVTMIGSNLSAANIVREKEIGTIEQLNVTPISKSQFLLGKLIPFWILGMLVLSFGLTLAYLVYGIVPVGSFLTIYGFAAIYLVAILGLGLLISTYSETQQQALFTSFFFMLIFIMLGGLYTSVDSMPTWAKLISDLNPITYFIEVMRRVVLKGSNFWELRLHFLAMAGFAFAFNTWAVLNYRKRN